jgi:c-di-GMP-binding flagellar brake protein YcgR
MPMSVAHVVDRAPRFALRVAAEVTVGGTVISGTTRNLSATGVCIELDRPLAEGSELGVRLIAVEEDIEDDSRGLQLAGQVQWAAESDTGYAVGVKFLRLSPQQTRALESALKSVG